MIFIQQYFPHFTAHQLQQFEMMLPFYTKWNDKINLISRNDILHFYERHVLHALAIAKFISFLPGTKILDVGTGGGFPGIPLAIAFPHSHFFLADSITKKIKVVDESVNYLKLNNVQTLNMRVENIAGDFDFIVSRAVASASEIVKWTHSLLMDEHHHNIPNGWLFLKGGNLNEEFEFANNKTTIQNLFDYFKTDFFEHKKLVYMPKI